MHVCGNILGGLKTNVLMKTTQPTQKKAHSESYEACMHAVRKHFNPCDTLWTLWYCLGLLTQNIIWGFKSTTEMTKYIKILCAYCLSQSQQHCIYSAFHSVVFFFLALSFSLFCFFSLFPIFLSLVLLNVVCHKKTSSYH